MTRSQNALLGLFCFALSSSAQPVLDQSLTPPSSYGAYDASINACCAYVAQTYTAGVTGTLAGVAVAIGSSSVFPLHVAIRSTLSGVPTTTVLGEVTLTSNSSALTQTIVFPQVIEQVAGNVYAIVVNYAGAPPAPQPTEQGNWSGATSGCCQDLYARGENWGSVNGVFAPHQSPVIGDLFFQTFVECTRPTITAVSASPNSLWPPNHKLVAVKVSVSETGGCGGVSCRIIAVSSNEPVDPDGDWVITGDLTLQLREERLGLGNGRVYTITVQCTDAAAKVTTKTVTVTVSHDQGH